MKALAHQPKNWMGLRMERIQSEFRAKQMVLPMLDQRKNGGNRKMLVEGRILREIGLSQFKKRGCRTQPFFAQMNKCARQLNQPLVKRPVRSVSVGQPKLFEHIMRFKELSAIEALEIAQVIWAEAAFGGGAD